MRKQITIICPIFLIIIFCIKILPLFMPIKYAVKELPQNVDQYWIVRNEKVTGYEWIIIGDQTGYYEDDVRNINILGNRLIRFNNEAELEDNTYICYGNIIHDIARERPNMGSFSQCIEEDVLNVDNWDVIYPIKRDIFVCFFLPRNYICLYDVYYDENYTFGEMLKGLYIWNYKSFIPKSIK